MEATAEDGSTAKLADETFRIFPLPKPIAKFAGKAGGNLKKSKCSKLYYYKGQSWEIVH